MLRVLCDQTHGQRDVSSFFWGLFTRALTLKTLSQGPISREGIAGADVLVIAPPERVNPKSERQTCLSSTEINTILEFVDNGNKLLLLNSAFADEPWNSKINELSENFGIRFNSNSIIDDTHCINNSPEVPLIQEIQEHHITESIKIFCYPSGCSLSFKSPSFGLAFSDKNSHVIGEENEKGSFPVFVAYERNRSKVAAMGSSLCFNVLFMENFDNRSLLRNITKWLTF